MIYRHLCGYLSISLLQTSIVVKYILNLRNESSMLRLPFISTLFKIVEPIGSCHLSICLMRLRRRAPDTKEKLLLTFFSFFFCFVSRISKKKNVWKAGKGFHAFCFLFWNVTVCSNRFFVNFLNYFSFLKYKLIFFKIFWYIKIKNIILIKKYFIKISCNSKASGITGQSRMRFPREFIYDANFSKNN